MKLIKEYTKQLPCKLTPPELQARGRELASEVQDKTNEEASQKNIKDQMKERLSELEARIKRHSSVVYSGEEYRDVKVEVYLGDNDVVTVKRSDTGEVVEGPRPARPEEQQLALDLVEKEAQEQPNAEAKKPDITVTPQPAPVAQLNPPGTVEGEVREITEEPEDVSHHQFTTIQDMPHSEIPCYDTSKPIPCSTCANDGVSCFRELFCVDSDGSYICDQKRVKGAIKDYVPASESPVAPPDVPGHESESERQETGFTGSPEPQQSAADQAFDAIPSAGDEYRAQQVVQEPEKHTRRGRPAKKVAKTESRLDLSTFQIENTSSPNLPYRVTWGESLIESNSKVQAVMQSLRENGLDFDSPVAMANGLLKKHGDSPERRQILNILNPDEYPLEEGVK
jgi:hypothetical protein